MEQTVTALGKESGVTWLRAARKLDVSLELDQHIDRIVATVYEQKGVVPLRNFFAGTWEELFSAMEIEGIAGTIAEETVLASDHVISWKIVRIAKPKKGELIAWRTVVAEYLLKLEHDADGGKQKYAFSVYDNDKTPICGNCFGRTIEAAYKKLKDAGYVIVLGRSYKRGKNVKVWHIAP